MKLRIDLQNTLEGHASELPTRAQFKQWIQCVFELLPSPQLQEKLAKIATLELTLRIIDIAESAELNATYRHKSGPTNVLSFPMDALEDVVATGMDFYLGDLAICAPIVQQEALHQQKPLLAHWVHLTVHGTLHLLGYDHEIHEEAEIMEALEVKILQHLGFGDPYVTRIT
jgi:probable rRNA maturation factor